MALILLDSFLQRWLRPRDKGLFFYPFSSATMYKCSSGMGSVTLWPWREQIELSDIVQFHHDITRKSRQKADP